MDEVEARELARRELGTDDLVITNANRIDRTWVISYNSRKYVETGDLVLRDRTLVEDSRL